MKKTKLLIFFSLVALSCSTLFAAGVKIEKNGWKIQYNEDSKTFDYTYNGDQIFSKAYPEAKYDAAGATDVTVTPSSFTKVSNKSTSINDKFGKGIQYTVKFEKSGSDISLEQVFFFYDKYDYFLTTLRLAGNSEIKSNYLAPIKNGESVAILPKSADNRMIMVPWDNDGFVRYESNKLDTEKTSYEVTSVYNGITRKGLVIGSIEHDIWKSGIKIKASANANLDEFVCYSGASSDLTRDKIPHGKVKGNTVSSAKMLVGYYNDWRKGMDEYGHANTLIVPARETWKKGTPIGWNSWGVIAEKLTFENVNDASIFFKDQMFDKGYHNDQGAVIIDLDSFWDNMSEYRIKDFAKKVKERGQVPGIYWCPFSYWGDNLDNRVEGSTYTYRDCALYVDGNAHKQGGYCLDPTHPAVKDRIRYQFKKFKEWGYEYVKLDFITNGAIQGDSYYNPAVTTGTQAYNEGSQVVVDAAGDDMFLSLSIAPMFPYQYGNSRRISCDAWGDIGQSQYVMNALSFGWWTDQFYQFNDPDHIVLQSNNGKETEGENRARLTTGAITGMMLLGDNYSDSSDRGNPAVSRERTLKLASNKDVIALANLGISFMPIYGHKATSNGAENLFVLETADYVYVACINYNSNTISVSGTLNFSEIGLDKNNVLSIKELWTGDDIKVRDAGFIYGVAPADARIYKIEKKEKGSGISSAQVAGENFDVFMSSPTEMTLTSESLINLIQIWNIQGQLLNQFAIAPSNEFTTDISSLQKGLVLIKCHLEDVGVSVKKFLLS